MVIVTEENICEEIGGTKMSGRKYKSILSKNEEWGWGISIKEEENAKEM